MALTVTVVIKATMVTLVATMKGNAVNGGNNGSGGGDDDDGTSEGCWDII